MLTASGLQLLLSLEVAHDHRGADRSEGGEARRDDRRALADGEREEPDDRGKRTHERRKHGEVEELLSNLALLQRVRVKQSAPTEGSIPNSESGLGEIGPTFTRLWPKVREDQGPTRGKASLPVAEVQSRRGKPYADLAPPTWTAV